MSFFGSDWLDNIDDGPLSISGSMKEDIENYSQGAIMSTIDVSGYGYYEHEVGNKNCREGWREKSSGFPKQCFCGGLIHADFGDEDQNCNYLLHKKCDKCGDNYQEKTN